MNDLQTFILFSVVLVVTVLSIVIIALRKQIMSFIRPHDYVSVTMLESDNNVRTDIIKKPANLRFKFNEGSYNLFESKILKNSPNVVTSIYRNGRLGHFFFIEGNENPLDFRNQEITGNPQLLDAILKQELSKLWEEPRTHMQELLGQIMPFIIIIGVIALIALVVYAFTHNPTGINPQGTEVIVQ